MDYDGGMMGSWGWPMMLVTGLFWVLLIGAAIWLAGWLSSRSRKFQQEEHPLDILKRRYARGEISREDYERMRQDLS